MSRTQSTITGHQDLDTGMSYDNDGNVIVPDVVVPPGTEIVQQDQIGVYRRTVFSNGAVETVQTEPIERGDASKVTGPIALPGEQQDSAGTGQDAVTKPKFAPGAEKSAKTDSPKTANK